MDLRWKDIIKHTNTHKRSDDADSKTLCLFLVVLGRVDSGVILCPDSRTRPVWRSGQVDSQHYRLHV